MSPENVRLTCPKSDATADVMVSLGMNCFSWRAPFREGEPARELLWASPGFEGGDHRPSGAGIPLLAPFPGRIAGSAFEWEGRRYELEPTGNNGHAIHGFALRKPWRTVERSGSSVTAEYQPSVDDPAALGQWPSDYLLRATYTIEGCRLTLDFSAENVGDRAMPFGFGTHAYFRLPLADGADPETTRVQAPVDAEWLSEDQIPTGGLEELPSVHPLRIGAGLGGREFDTPYRFAPGATTTELVDPATGHGIRQTFDGSMTCCVIYTPGHREAICLEPYTCVPDPIALASRGVESGLIALAPGNRYATQVVLEAFGEKD